ncbi:tetratricopeptide repeat protein [Saccharolobus islandicus]|uniref:TPR repeat protein n=5 Tax=Saccharolobus islandicus TaxID=43080 RepID=M9U3B0_SACIS|nr:tetratricopeptide repeat protein [Sulfolobus islandicus]ACP54037.1 Tetratricopeptide TPR_2 repeat protein [Sulfolobus islandicus M.16.27]ACR40644.1 Tetratricopeptide TPR_2 repeat protein [Sulfolobus islandicus M.16.4]ADX81380.1 tetratricopeptide TPR_2 repeat protein [Sulfolobus islandicus HVE10/4]ADX84103.1 Tetratricopeptide TPR_2 repeat protein [Sulfolobus islandicus REY15A]AGJ61489.1 TPR repeat protein [Sulfolobus islandicus LAL14/1]
MKFARSYKMLILPKRLIDILSESMSLKEAYTQYKNRNLNYALKLLDELITQDPDLKEAYSLKGKILFELGKLQEAYENFQKAEDKIGMAKVLIAQGLYRDALTYLDDNSKESSKLRGLIYLKLENYEKALDETKTIEDEDPLIYKIRGISELKLGRYNDAIIDLSFAIEKYPTDAELYFYRALAQRGLGNYKEAESDLEMAINLNPYYAEVYFSLGELKESRGLLQEAVDMYSKTININPLYRSAYVRRAKSLMKLGREDEAYADIRKANELDSS